MRYIKAEEILPPDLLALVQTYAQGRMLYIPKKQTGRNDWGSVSGTKAYYAQRNAAIRTDAHAGMHPNALAKKYSLTPKSIQRILREGTPSCRQKRKEGQNEPGE